MSYQPEFACNIAVSASAFQSGKPVRTGRTFALAVCFGVVYFLSGKFGLSLAYLNASASPIWPPTGIALACLLLWGNRLWPIVFIGAFLVNITTQGSALTSLAIAAGNTIEALSGAWLVSRFAGGSLALTTPRRVLKFVGLAALLSTSLSATVGVTSLCVAGFSAWTLYGPTWLTWWLGDMVSDLTVAPLILIWAQEAFPTLTRARVVEAAALGLSILFLGSLIFPIVLPVRDKNIPIAYFALLPLLWATFRFGARGAISAAILTSAIALTGTVYGAGPFIKTDPNHSLLFVQTFIGTITLTSLLLAVVVSAQKQSEQEIKNLNSQMQAQVRQLAKAKEELEARVAERTAELRQTNTELEAFSFSLSHDLRAPLRSIRSFTQFALDDCRPVLGEHAGYLERVLSSAQRLDRLVQDVLAFTRISRQPITVRSLDLENLLQEIIGERPELQHPLANIQITRPLPAIRGDEASLTQCVTNLLDNAIKFVDAGKIPAVRIWSEPTSAPSAPSNHRPPEPYVRLWFEDNGIGIDQSAQKSIFDLFQRVHSGQTFEGSGLGLAIVRKAVERMNGAVGLRSQPGKGSSFWLDLPKA